ncbi:hypothetical protein VNO77_02699 [Canavalia gladiata]|uniref:Uncharacterized protein n=1 Tax=Canavalia gladiata TaxID=3824 RepID=A0AAN9MTH4_CANGL
MKTSRGGISFGKFLLASLNDENKEGFFQFCWIFLKFIFKVPRLSLETSPSSPERTRPFKGLLAFLFREKTNNKSSNNSCEIVFLQPCIISCFKNSRTCCRNIRKIHVVSALKERWISKTPRTACSLAMLEIKELDVSIERKSLEEKRFAHAPKVSSSSTSAARVPVELPHLKSQLGFHTSMACFGFNLLSNIYGMVHDQSKGKEIPYATYMQGVFLRPQSVP